jgi:hypothetical protein
MAKAMKTKKTGSSTLDSLATWNERHPGEVKPLSKPKKGKSKAAPVQEAPKSTPQAIPTPRKSVEPTGGTHPKATAFLVDAKGLGWDGVVEPTGRGEVRVDTVTVRRGPESILIEWQNGVFTPPCIWTRPDGTTRKLNNASAAKTTMALAPPTAEQMAARSVARTRVGAPKTTTVAALPFDPALMTDEELASALQGRKITWVNRISGAVDAEMIPPQATVRIRDLKSGRTIDFNGSVARSVLVASITSISGSAIKQRGRYSAPIINKTVAGVDDAANEFSDEELAVFAADEEDGA